MNMKNITTNFLLHANALLRLAALMIILISANTMFAQNKGEEIGDLSGIIWKDTDLANIALTEETTRIDLSLATPDLQDVDRTLFTAYKLLVNYVQLGIQSGESADKAIVRSYEQVLTGNSKEFELKDLRTDIFATYIPGLVEVLAAPLVPVMGQY
jgi:hypothetical protein